METKNHFNNPVVIILVIALIGLSGYIVFSQTQNKPQSTQENTTTNPQQSEIDNLQKQLDALKQKETTDTKSAQKSSNPDLASIIAQWRNRTAYLLCGGANAYGQATTQSATAYISKGEDNIIRAITNRHAVIDQTGNIVSNCVISLPDAPKTFSITSQNIILPANQSIDVAAIVLDSSDPYLQSITSQKRNVCFKQNTDKPYLGDQILVLGYPAIGSPTDITATDGIISGYDYPYYITSAKIDHGNSGGVAVLVKDDCYLGIPTGSVVGQIESLGRILDGTVINNTPTK